MDGYKKTIIVTALYGSAEPPTHAIIVFWFERKGLEL